MKSFTILLSIFLIAIGTSFSQDPTFGESTAINSFGEGPMAPGRWYLGGMLGFVVNTGKHEDGSNVTDDPKNTEFDIIPTLGYVINDKWAVALGIGYTSFSTKTVNDIDGNNVDLKSKSGQFVIMPKVGYFKQLTNNLYCIPYFYVGFGFGNSYDEEYDFIDEQVVKINENKLSSFEIGVAPSLKYFLSDYWAISLSYGKLYYQNTTKTDKENTDHKEKTSNYGLDLDLSSINFGLYYFFE